MEPHPPELLTANFSFRIGGRSLSFTVEVPTAPVTLKELLPALFDFNRQLLEYSVANDTQAGKSVSCRAGCGACCSQLVPVSRTEAMLVREWVDSRPAEEALAIRERFASAIDRLRAAGLYNRLGNRSAAATQESVRALGLDYFKAGCACPFLVEDSCSIYPVRPMKCREYLVTSPAENCREPSSDSIDMIDFPVSFLKVLLKMETWLYGTSPWMPLTFLFEEEGLAEEPRKPGPEMFQRFVAEFANGNG